MRGESGPVLDLCTTVDSGYRLFGLPLLTRDEVDENLYAILKACAGRIDVLA